MILILLSAPWSKAGYPSIFTIGEHSVCIYHYISLPGLQRLPSRTRTMQIFILAMSECNYHIGENYSLDFSRIDVSSEFSFEHMLEFSKLAIAFAIELGGL